MSKQRLTVGAFHDNGQLIYHYHTEVVSSIAHAHSRAASVIRAATEDWDYSVTPV